MAIPSSLPTGWFNYSPNQKAIWFMDNGVTPDDMRQVGVPESDINALMQFGYDAAKAASVDQQNKLASEEVARREAEMLRIIEQQKIAEQQAQAEQQRLAAVAAQESARQEAARQEAARAAAAEAARQESIRVAAAQEQARAAAAAEQERLNQQRLSTQLALYIDPSSSGNAWKSLGSQEMLNQIGQRLRNVTGIDDINDLEVRTKNIPVNVTVRRMYNEDFTPIYTKDGEPQYGKLINGSLQPLTPEELKNVKSQVYESDIAGVIEILTLDTIQQQDGIYNKKTGKLVAQADENNLVPTLSLGGWGEGDQMTYAYVEFDANGKPNITTFSSNSGFEQDIVPILSIALMAIPGVGQAVGSALLPSGVSVATATAFGNAVINAGLQVASGVPVEKAILNSAASLGVSQLVPNLSGNVYIDNAVKSVATAALTGGDVGNALANSLIATGGNELLGNTSFTGDKVVDSAIASAITSGVQAAATDGDVGASIIRGGIAGGSSELSKQTASSESAKSGAGFIGEDAVDSVAGAIGNDIVSAAQDDVLGILQKEQRGTTNLDPVNEANFQNWIRNTEWFKEFVNEYGEEPDLNTKDYDYRAAWKAGVVPERDPYDQNRFHWPSSLPSGEMLKSEDHPTAWKEYFMRDTGLNPDALGIKTPEEAEIYLKNKQSQSIDPRILAQGVTGGQFGEGGFLQTGGNIGVNVLPPNPQSEFGVQKNINARADFNESSLGAKYGEINSPHWGKLISSIMINDVVDSNGNPIDTPVGYYAIYDPDTKSTFYEFSLSDGTTVTSKTRPFVEQGKIFSEDKFYELKPSRQPSELNIDTGAGSGAFLGGTEDLVKEPVPGITISASKPIIDQRLLDLVEQAPDQESATNATVAYYQALDNDLSDDEALNAAKTAMQAKSPEILFNDSIVEQQPNEQQVADTGLTVVGQPVNQTPVVSPTTPSVTQPVVSEPVAQQPTAPDIVTTTPSITQPAQKTELQSEIDRIMRMAVGQETTDLRYDVNKDGRVNSRDAYLVNAGQATIPTAEQYAAQQSASSSTAPSTTPQVTQPVDQTPATTATSTVPATSTGVVLQNNGDGTALVLTNDGNATNVPATDARSNEPLTPGSSVTIDQNTNTATATPPASDGGAQAPIVSAPPTVQDTGDQQVLGGGQQPTTDAGSIIDTPIGPDTSTPTVPEPVVQEPVVQEPPPPPPPPPAVPTTPEEPITELPQEPVVDKTEEDLLLEQIIKELEPTPPVSEGVPIPEPEFPEPPLVLPESPTINVADRLTVRPVVDRGYRRPSVSPGSRVEESAQILPLRPGLSEGGTGGIEGTTEQEQKPVWNVRSLKLRRLLGI